MGRDIVKPPERRGSQTKLLFMSLCAIVCAAVAGSGSVAGSNREDPRILKGDALTAYRDPAALWHAGTFHVYFTLVETDSDRTVHSFVAHVMSRDMKTWTKPEKITPKSVMDGMKSNCFF